MIRDSKEAKRITDPNGTFSNDDPTRLRAESYLSGMRDPAVLAFSSLEADFRKCKRSMKGDGICCACVDRFFDALFAYKEAVKKP